MMIPGERDSKTKYPGTGAVTEAQEEQEKFCREAAEAKEKAPAAPSVCRQLRSCQSKKARMVKLESKNVGTCARSSNTRASHRTHESLHGHAR